MNYPIYMIIFFLILFTIIFYATSNSKIAERKMTMIILSKDKTKCAEYNRTASITMTIYLNIIPTRNPR